MATHKITVEVTGNTSQRTGNEEEIVSQSPTSGAGQLIEVSSSGGTSATGLLSSFASAVPVALVASKVIGYGRQVTESIVGRLGTYSGNGFIDSDLSNLKTGLTLSKSFLKDPLSATIDVIGAMRDFKLTVKKQNLEAAYRAYELNYERGILKL